MTEKIDQLILELQYAQACYSAFRLNDCADDKDKKRLIDAVKSVNDEFEALQGLVAELENKIEHISANWQEEHAQVIRLEERLKSAKAQIDQTFYSDNEPGYTEGGDG